MFKKIAVAAFALALMAPNARANGIITLESDEQAYVYLDGDEVGTTPMTLRDIEPGHHDVRMENPRTGQVRDYSFYSPHKTTVQKNFAVAFAREPMPARRVVVEERVVAAPPPTTYVEERVVTQGPPPEEHHDNTKVRMRNTILGAGLVNEVFNNGKSKSTIRKGVVGGGLLNELLNK